MLLRAGADPDRGDENGETPLHKARGGEITEALLTGSGDPCILDNRDRVAVGEGALVWTRDRDSYKVTGRMVDGKAHGRWVVRYADGTCYAVRWSGGSEVEGSLKDR